MRKFLELLSIVTLRAVLHCQNMSINFYLVSSLFISNSLADGQYLLIVDSHRSRSHRQQVLSQQRRLMPTSRPQITGLWWWWSNSFIDFHRVSLVVQRPNSDLTLRGGSKRITCLHPKNKKVIIKNQKNS